MDHTPILPATASLESIERFLHSNMGIVPLSAVARALSGFNRDQLGSAIEVLIALMDIADPDPDLEDATDVQDDEEDDAPEEDDDSGQNTEDEISSGGRAFGWAGPRGPGCPISDPDAEHDDMEREQLADDVPMLPVFSAAHNVFTKKRVPLGISNLMSSFVGQDVRSADTGAVHSGRALAADAKPDVPV